MSRHPLPKFDRWPMPPTPACQIGPGWTELPWTTRWRCDARALLVVAMAKLMRLLPYGVACALGRCMGSVACRLNGALRRTALENLGRAFQLLDDARRRDLERDSLRHFGQLVAEMTQDRYSDWHIEELVDYPPECQRVVEEALAQKRGVVMVTGHIGNWEIIGRPIARAGQPLFVVAREQNAPPSRAGSSARAGSPASGWCGAGPTSASAKSCSDCYNRTASWRCCATRTPEFAACSFGSSGTSRRRRADPGSSPCTRAHRL